jgi:hypothetical protein
MRMRKLVATVPLAVALALAGATTAHPAGSDTVCTGIIVTGTFDNVVVPRNQGCVINNAVVRGSVKVYGFLIVNGPTFIAGDIDGEPGHGFVRLSGAVLVNGDVQLKGNTGGVLPGGFFNGAAIRGDFQWEGNAGPLFASGGSVRGNVWAEKNTGGGLISGVAIGGDIECKENTPTIFDGDSNSVGGNDDCPASP